jgi:lactoylglutathione lyase
VGLANGGTSAGEPGPRPNAGNMHGAYLFDPDGNKISAYNMKR